MNDTRRTFLIKAPVVLAAGCLCCSAPVLAQFPTSRTDRPDLDGTRRPVAPAGRQSFAGLGCALRVTSTAGGERALLGTTGIPALDQYFVPELTRLMQYFGVVVGVFTDGQRNAFATTERLTNHVRPDGTVVLGRALIQELYEKFDAPRGGYQGNSVVGVLAHEFAHIVFFKSGQPMPRGKRPELHADYMAGWYMGIRSLQAPGRIDLVEIHRQMFDIGDTNFTSPDHHGTPRERANSFMVGVNLSYASRGRASLADAFRQASQHVGL